MNDGRRTGRTARAGTSIALGVAAGVLSFLAVGPSWWVLPYLVLAAVTGPLVVVDLREHRLPNRIVLPALASILAALALAALLESDPAALLGGVVGGAVLFGAYVVLALAAPGAMGMGDAKLAAVLGVALGALPWPGWIVGVAAGFAIGAVAALVAVVTRRATWRTRIPFGPAMIAGCWVAVVVVGAARAW